MNWNRWLVYSSVFVIAFSIGALLFSAFRVSSDGEYTEVDWYKLGDYDYITGGMSDSLRTLDGKKVKIPGFMVPLEDNMRKASTFLLVPSPQACIHVPPPPPNQMVLAESKKGDGVEVRMYVPIWTFGTFRILNKKHQFGESSFEIEIDRVDNYN
jgi:hypothetical protein